MVLKERRWSKEMSVYLLQLISSLPNKNNYAEIANKINLKFNCNFSAEDVNFRFSRLKNEYKNFKKTEGFSKRKKWTYWDLFQSIEEVESRKDYNFKEIADFLNEKFKEIENFFQ